MNGSFYAASSNKRCDRGYLFLKQGTDLEIGNKDQGIFVGPEI